MAPFTTVRGAAAHLPNPNVDTDVIMPKQFLTGIDRSGLRDGVLFYLRFEAPGKPNPDFVLNRAGWEDTRFLVVGPNFGCGSSREHAVWGLKQLGIRALIGTSFAGIFNDNCLRNGVLTIALRPTEIEELANTIARADRNHLAVDLPAQTITSATGNAIRFDVDPIRKDALVRGLDAVGSTLEYADDIRRFEQNYFSARPWLR